jgi:predicted esterase
MPDEGRSATERTIETQTHGRYLVLPGSDSGRLLLVGFHGYGETAEAQLDRLREIPGSDRWTLVSVQGLHQFYRRRTNEIVASWMTRQNRELAIADNIAYVARVIHALSDERSAGQTLVLAGFSQGVAMAFRAAVTVDMPIAGVIACGGDVPPELDAKALSRIPSVLIGRGVRDEWYTAEKLASDERRLRAAGVVVEAVVLDAAHDWTPEFAIAGARFIESSLARQ